MYYSGRVCDLFGRVPSSALITAVNYCQHKPTAASNLFFASWNSIYLTANYFFPRQSCAVLLLTGKILMLDVKVKKDGKKRILGVDFVGVDMKSIGLEGRGCDFV